MHFFSFENLHEKSYIKNTDLRCKTLINDYSSNLWFKEINGCSTVGSFLMQNLSIHFSHLSHISNGCENEKKNLNLNKVKIKVF